MTSCVSDATSEKSVHRNGPQKRKVLGRLPVNMSNFKMRQNLFAFKFFQIDNNLQILLKNGH